MSEALIKSILTGLFWLALVFITFGGFGYIQKMIDQRASHKLSAQRERQAHELAVEKEHTEQARINATHDTSVSLNKLD